MLNAFPAGHFPDRVQYPHPYLATNGRPAPARWAGRPLRLTHRSTHDTSAPPRGDHKPAHRPHRCTAMDHVSTFYLALLVPSLLLSAFFSSSEAAFPLASKGAHPTPR